MLNARDPLKGILDNFVLLVVSLCDSYEQFHFMQDGTPEGTARPVLARPDNHFTGRWIGRRGSTEWLPRSLGLNPSYLFLRVCTKGEVTDRNQETNVMWILTSILRQFLCNSHPAQVSYRSSVVRCTAGLNDQHYPLV